jgi:hypothetical protein
VQEAEKATSGGPSSGYTGHISHARSPPAARSFILDENEGSRCQISLDPRCLNCFGTSGKDKASIINGFKMACLNYQSSKVKVPTGDLLSRSAVTQKQEVKIKLLQHEYNSGGLAPSFIQEEIQKQVEAS